MMKDHGDLGRTGSDRQRRLERVVPLIGIEDPGLIAAQAGIAGSATIGDGVMMAGQSGVAGHLDVGPRVKIGAKSAVLQPVAADGFVTGVPAIEHSEWRKASVIFRQLPSLKKRVDELQQRIAELEEELARCRDPKDG